MGRVGDFKHENSGGEMLCKNKAERRVFKKDQWKRFPHGGVVVNEVHSTYFRCFLINSLKSFLHLEKFSDAEPQG